MTSYVYVKSEPTLWTVGFYRPDGRWEAESDHGDADEAAQRVARLNGSDDAMSDLPTDVKMLRVQLRHALEDAEKGASVYEAMVELYRNALGRILNLAQDDEGGDMIPPILQTVRLALDEGITYDAWSDKQRQQHMAGIDLSGRPA